MHPRRPFSRMNRSFFDSFSKTVLYPSSIEEVLRLERVHAHARFPSMRRACCSHRAPVRVCCMLCACACPLERDSCFFARFGRHGSATNVARRGNPPAPSTSPRSAGRRSFSSVRRRPAASTRSAGIGAGGCTFAQRLCLSSAAPAGAQKAASGSRRNLCQSEPGTLRGELGRSSARFSRDLAGKTPPPPQTEAAIAEGKDFVLLCCVVCVLCGNPPTRFGGRRAAEAASPSRGCFLQKMASSPSCFLPGRGCETQGNILRGASRQPPQVAFTPRTRPPAFPGVFLQAVGRLGSDLASRKDAQRWEGGHRCCAPSGFFGCERKVARPSAKHSRDSVLSY